MVSHRTRSPPSAVNTQVDLFWGHGRGHCRGPSFHTVHLPSVAERKSKACLPSPRRCQRSTRGRRLCQIDGGKEDRGCRWCAGQPLTLHYLCRLRQQGPAVLCPLCKAGVWHLPGPDHEPPRLSLAHDGGQDDRAAGLQSRRMQRQVPLRHRFWGGQWAGRQRRYHLQSPGTPLKWENLCSDTISSLLTVFVPWWAC